VFHFRLRHYSLRHPDIFPVIHELSLLRGILLIKFQARQTAACARFRLRWRLLSHTFSIELSILYMMYNMTNLIFKLATVSMILAFLQSQQPIKSLNLLSSFPDIRQVFAFAPPLSFIDNDIGGVM
jgi:hypothetical protein